MSRWRNGYEEMEGDSSFERSNLSSWVTHDKKNTQVNTHPLVYTVGKFCKILLKPQNNFINKNFAVLMFSTEEENRSCEANLLTQQLTRQQGPRLLLKTAWFGDYIHVRFTREGACCHHPLCTTSIFELASHCLQTCLYSRGTGMVPQLEGPIAASTSLAGGCRAPGTDLS